TQFSDLLPLYVMAELLGVDPDQRPMFKRCGDVIVSSSDTEALANAQRELTEYLAELFIARRAEPREDLISVLLSASPEGDALPDDDLLGLCFLLLVAGTETTTSALGNALLLLDRHRDARGRVLADPALLPTAADEILRFDSPVQGLCRVVTRDVEVDGVTIPAGARVHLLFASANRDERAFPDPDAFDVGRTPNNHAAFGFGIHFCLGASLARMELKVGVQELLARAPGYEVLLDGVARTPSDTNRVFARLPVVLQGAG